MFRGMYRGSGQGGGSSGDQHNLGWYATPEALRTAHATATAGDWAIVGSTDTVWIWDTDTNAWKDSDQKGQVASVNGQTGTVVLTASDVGAATAAQGAKADTAVQPADLATVATTGDYDDLTNKPTLGTAASADTTDFATAAQGALADTAIQSVKTINGQSIVGTGDVTVGGLPDQTGQNGKFLTTDGTDASWSDKPLVNTYTGQFGALGILGTVGSTTMSGIAIGSSAKNNGTYSTVAIGPNAYVGYVSYCTAIGGNARAEYAGGTSIGAGAISRAVCAIQIGGSTNGQSNVNSDANTFKVANANGNFEIMSADGTIPEARLADTTNAQQGDVLTLDSNGNAVWQAGSSGGVSDVTVNGTSVVSGGVAAITCATIDDTSTSSLTATWSASKLNTTIGDIETLINAL